VVADRLHGRDRRVPGVRGADPGGPYTLATTTADKFANSASVTGLFPGTPYFLVVRTLTNAHAKNQSALQSEPSAEVSTTTLGHRVKLRRHLTRPR